MQNIKYSRHSLRNFGITMGTVLALITFLSLRKHGNAVFIPSSASALFFFFALFLPLLLKPVYACWMKLAFVLSWINTRLLLIAVFYLLFVPISLGFKLFGLDLLGIKQDSQRDSYWVKRQKKQFEKKDYENQF